MKKANILLVCLLTGAVPLAIAQGTSPRTDDMNRQQSDIYGNTDTQPMPGDLGTQQQQQQQQDKMRQDADRDAETTGYSDKESRDYSRHAKRAKGFTMKNGRMMFVMPEGETMPMDRETKINGLKANPDGTITLRDGNTVTLKEGDAVAKNGIMGVTMRDGKVMALSADGQARDVRRDVTLMDGTKVSKDGRVTMKDGRTMTLGNDDTISADGMLKRGSQEIQRQQEQQGQQEQPQRDMTK